MNIILWIGNEPNQRALANKIHAKFPVTAIVTETRKSKRKLTLKKFIEKVIEKIFLSVIGDAWFKMQEKYDAAFPNYPKVKRLGTENINSQEVYDFTKSFDPDIIIVSGTRLIKENMFALKPRIGILNLHTGLSPYVKGGPNCTNWCIATKQFHLIGNTIMWLDAGIDTGNIITTEITEFTGNESFYEVHFKVMEHAHTLYIKAIEYLISGKTSNVPQKEIAAGKTYYNKNWGLTEKMKLVRNFKLFKKIINSDVYKNKGIKTIKLN
jgi:methionyl-tRNA formyltransferase